MLVQAKAKKVVHDDSDEDDFAAESEVEVVKKPAPRRAAAKKPVYNLPSSSDEDKNESDFEASD